ncbi:hypothetical protein MTsDn1_26370 [Alteromonas sp. MTD1]
MTLQMNEYYKKGQISKYMPFSFIKAFLLNRDDYSLRFS